MNIKPYLSEDRLVEIADRFEQENYHSESAMVMPLLQVAGRMESILRRIATDHAVGETEILTVLLDLQTVVGRCQP